MYYMKINKKFVHQVGDKKVIVREVGHLPGLYEDAWSEKYKIYTVLNCTLGCLNIASVHAETCRSSD